MGGEAREGTLSLNQELWPPLFRALMKVAVVVFALVVIGVVIGFPSTHVVKIKYANLNCSGEVQWAVATAEHCGALGCMEGIQYVCNGTDIETRLAGLHGASLVTYTTCGDDSTAQVSFTPDGCTYGRVSGSQLSSCNTTHVEATSYTDLGCSGTANYTLTPLSNCTSTSMQALMCGSMYLTGMANPAPAPSNPAEPPPSPVAPPPNPVLARPVAACWANKQVDGQTTQIAFFDVQITTAGTYNDSSYFDGTSNMPGTTTFETTGTFQHFLHFGVTPSNAMVSWTLNGTTAGLDTSSAAKACPNTPVVVLLAFTGTAPDQTVIASLVDLVANITGLAKENIQIEIVVSAKRASYTVKVTMTGDANVSPQVASAALVDDFNNDPTAFETATGGTAGAASYPPPPSPPPSPPSPPMPTPPPTTTPPTGPNSAVIMTGSLVVVSLLALLAL